MDDTAIDRAFAAQSVWGAKLGSPFMEALMRALPRALDRSTATGRRLRDWQGDPSALGDSVPLRLAGALHILARSGAAPELALVYPPHPTPDDADLARACAAATASHDARIHDALDLPPQTNEVARSALLYPGLAEIARRTGLPLALYEIGSSAGLNLACDRFAYHLGGRDMGITGSPVVLSPAWSGPPPQGLEPRITSRIGCDISLVDIRDEAARERLIGFVWADQTERLARLAAALDIALRDPPRVERADAAAWVSAWCNDTPPRGVARVLMHSVTFQYLPSDARAAVRNAMERAGERASADAPLGWLAFENEGSGAGLTLTLWPDGNRQVLARGDAHGRSVTWCA
jgi:hypothetical protein